MTGHLRASVIAFLGLAAALHAQTQAPPALAPAAGVPLPAQELIGRAISDAKNTKRTVLVEFSASWCGWCHRFEAFLSDSVVGKYMSAEFVTVQLIVLESAPDKKLLENAGGEALMKANGATGGIPFFYFVDTLGRRLGDANIMPGNGNVGHPNQPEEIVAFDALLKKVAPRMTDAHRKEIKDWLKKHSTVPQPPN